MEAMITAIRSLMACLFNPHDVVEFTPYPTSAGRVPNKYRHWFKAGEADDIWRACTHQFGAFDSCHGLHAFKFMPCFGVNPRDESCIKIRRGTQDLVTSANTLFVDFDEGTHVEVAQLRRDECGLPPPTATVKTPNGCHMYWRLAEQLTREQLPTWTALQDALSAKLRVDSAPRQVDSTNMLTKLMRLPGFTDTKKRPVGWQPVHTLLCELHECKPGLVWDISEFPTPADVVALAAQPVVVVQRDGVTLHKRIKDFVERGSKGMPAKIGRHLYTWQMARDLCARGWTQQAATELLCNACAKHFPSGDNSLATAWEQRNLAQQIDNAFTKALPAKPFHDVPQQESATVMTNTQQEIANAATHRIRELAAADQSHLVTDAFNGWMQTQGRAQIGIPTERYPILTQRLCGWRGVTYVAAQTNMGKTVFAASVWLEAARGHDTCALYIGTEQSNNELTQRTIAAMAAVPYDDCALGLIQHRKSDAEYYKLKPHMRPSLPRGEQSGLCVSELQDLALGKARDQLTQLLKTRLAKFANVSELGRPLTKLKPDGHIFDAVRELVEAQKRATQTSRCLVVIDYLDAIENIDHNAGMSDIAKQNHVLSALLELSSQTPDDAYLVIRQQSKSHAGQHGNVNNMYGAIGASYNGAGVIELYEPDVEVHHKSGDGSKPQTIKEHGTKFGLSRPRSCPTPKDAVVWTALNQNQLVGLNANAVVVDVVKVRQGGSKGKELFVFDYVRHELHECGSQAEFNAITQEIRERNDPNSTASKERIKQLMRDAGKPKLQKV
jgi:hypothetical protein